MNCVEELQGLLLNVKIKEQTGMESECHRLCKKVHGGRE